MKGKNAENPELQCKSSSKSVNCRDSSVSFPYRVGHIIPWVLPKKPVTVQISDSHGPGNMSHHMLLWHRLPQHHQYHWVLIWGSCVAALGMDGETMLLRESGQEWRDTKGGKKLVFSLLGCHLQGKYPVCILLQTTAVYTFFSIVKALAFGPTSGLLPEAVEQTGSVYFWLLFYKHQVVFP